MRPRRSPPETETLASPAETRPRRWQFFSRRDVGTSRDRDHNPGQREYHICKRTILAVSKDFFGDHWELPAYSDRTGECYRNGCICTCGHCHYVVMRDVFIEEVIWEGFLHKQEACSAWCIFSLTYSQFEHTDIWWSRHVWLV